jgi:nucleoid DNA-binding protein
LELNQVIQQLLNSNDYVSLPTLGSFVQHYEPARLSADGATFLPPRQLVTFDISRTFNDGLLESYLTDSKGITSLEAGQQVANYVDKVKKALNSGALVAFEHVGVLKKDHKGTIAFEPEADAKRVSSTYGLEAVKVESKPTTPITPKPTTPPYQPKATPTHSVGSVGLPLILAASAMTILMLISGLMFFIPELRFWHNDTIVVESDSKPDYIIDNSTSLSQPSLLPIDTAELEVSVDNIDTEPTPVKEKVAITTDKKRALYYEEPVKPDDKTYYIIAGSFESADNARVLAASLAKSGFTPEILQSDGRYRVALSKFTDRNRALRELARLRGQKATESVWLLGL